MQTYGSTYDSAGPVPRLPGRGRFITPPRHSGLPADARGWRRLCDLSWSALKGTWLRLQTRLPGVPERYWEETRQ
jgi:hypothetical protein